MAYHSVGQEGFLDPVTNQELGLTSFSLKKQPAILNLDKGNDFSVVAYLTYWILKTRLMLQFLSNTNVKHAVIEPKRKTALNYDCSFYHFKW
jgi:hypothetical protein